MALQYGMNFLASDMRNILEQHRDVQNGVRTWQKLFGNASLGNQAQVGALKADYTDAITQAYKSNLAQRNAILGAGLSAGSTDALLEANRQNLHNTYKQYVGSYNSDMATLNQNYQQEVGAISDALDERAKNFSDLYNSAYKYVTDRLSGASLSRDNMNKPTYDEKGNFTGYEQDNISYLDAAKLDWLKDAEGNLFSWNQISNQLVNTDGTLNEKGREFFDKVFNAMPQGYLDEEGEKVEGFDEWLSKENSALRDWMISSDEFSQNKVGTNLGTAKSMLGLEADDFSGANFNYLDENDISRTITNAQTYFTELMRDREAFDIFDREYHMHTLYNKYNDNIKVGDILEESVAMKQAKRDADEAWVKYVDKMDTQHSDFLDELKIALGSEKYNQFIETGAGREYNDLMDKARKGTYDKSLYNELNKAYSDFIARAQSYMYSAADIAYKPSQFNDEAALRAAYRSLGVYKDRRGKR